MDESPTEHGLRKGSTLLVHPATFVEVQARLMGFTQPVEVFEPVMVRTGD